VGGIPRPLWCAATSVAERWLTDVLGLNWLAADEEAGRLEHALSDAVTDRLYKLIGEPRTCPHGNPIRPLTEEERKTPLVSLDEVPRGVRVRLRRISELAEDNHELMVFYEINGVRPGAGLRITDHGPLNGPLTVVRRRSGSVDEPGQRRLSVGLATG